jgi:hypothetical protein
MGPEDSLPCKSLLLVHILSQLNPGHALTFYLTSLLILSRVGVTKPNDFGLEIGFIDHFHTRLVITLNYSAITDFHTLQTSL